MPEILYTPRYEDELVRICKYSARKWGSSVAEWTLKQIAEVEQWTYLSGRSRIRSSALYLPNWNRVSAKRSTKFPKTRNERIWTSVRCRDNPAIGCGLVDGVLYVLDETGLTVKVVASRGSAYQP